jgi:cytoskeleton protein RodZ
MDVNTDEVVEPRNKKSTNIGELLIEARENRNWSAQEIADQMNLTLSVIKQIEENRFNENIPHAFLRGYIRSYAQRVGVDTESICAEFDIQINANVEPVKNLKVVSQFKTRRKEINSNSFIFKLVTSIIVIAILSFAGWELFKRVGKSDTPAQENNIELSQLESNSANVLTPNVVENEVTTNSQLPESESVVAEELAINNSSEITPESIKQNQDLSVESANNQLPEDSNDANINQLDLTDSVVSLIEMTFTFSADCWVKIVDGAGETIAIGVKKAGRVMPLSGVAPVTVVLGDPAGVSLNYNDKTFDTSVYPAGRRAEFVLN